MSKLTEKELQALNIADIRHHLTRGWRFTRLCQDNIKWQGFCLILLALSV